MNSHNTSRNSFHFLYKSERRETIHASASHGITSRLRVRQMKLCGIQGFPERFVLFSRAVNWDRDTSNLVQRTVLLKNPRGIEKTHMVPLYLVSHLALQPQALSREHLFRFTHTNHQPSRLIKLISKSKFNWRAAWLEFGQIWERSAGPAGEGEGGAHVSCHPSQTKAPVAHCTVRGREAARRPRARTVAALRHEEVLGQISLQV